MSKKLGKCKLCLEEKALVDSHIVPRSFNKLIKGDNPYTLIIGDSLSHLKRSNIGIYDQILCCSCESMTSKYDEVGIKVLKEIINSTFFNCGLYETLNIDKGEIKLFFLFVYSVLWRACISNKEEFKSVELGSKHKEAIRNAILKNDINDLINPDIFILKLKSSINDVYTVPLKAKKLEGINVYHLYFSSIQVLVKVDSKVIPKTLRSVSNFQHINDNYLIYQYGKSDKLKSMALSIVNNMKNRT